jgi:hypothetical protein
MLVGRVTIVCLYSVGIKALMVYLGNNYVEASCYCYAFRNV